VFVAEWYVEDFDHLKHPPKVSVVRIRPHMSITKAVRLLTEARKQGVELCMVRVDQRNRLVYLSTNSANGERSERHFDQDDVAARWIVATPEDARKIDARGKK
jgi:hypothetical protein